MSESDRLVLRRLEKRDERSFGRALISFSSVNPSFDFAFDYREEEPFSDYVDRVRSWEKGQDLPETFVPNTFFVGVQDGEILGRLSLRHEFNVYLERIGGHIGYAVAPRYRGRGVATEMLKQAMPFCREIGLKRVLITCDVDNAASARAIEKCGGKLEGITQYEMLPIQKKRYWITV